MKSKIIFLGVCVLFAAAAVWAADVAGKWTAHVAAQGQGDSEITLVLKVADGKITGTINNSAQPGDVEIQDGKISGEDVSFSLKRKIGENDLTILWKGKLSGDEIKFVRTTAGAAGPGGGAPTEIVAKRAN